MYLTKLLCKNLGPVQEVVLRPRFTKSGNPCPIVLVGKNGTGKTVLLSNIIDALYEFSAKAFTDVAEPMNGSGHLYYKLLDGGHISVGADAAFSYLKFDFSAGGDAEYYYSIGAQKTEELKSLLMMVGEGCSSVGKKNFADQVGVKGIVADKKSIEQEFDRSVVCYFPSYRSSFPDWLAKPYQDGAEKKLSKHLRSRFMGELGHGIEMSEVQHDIAMWVFDVLVDAKATLDLVSSEGDSGRVVFDEKFSNPLNPLRVKANIDTILSRILEKDVQLALRPRSYGAERIVICEKGDKQHVLVRSLDALSTGQALLMEMFLSILQQADLSRTGTAYDLGKLTGIVVVDEVDTHLHADLLRETLPRLVRLFPGVQFIFTTHSPFFVLGMEDAFRDDLDIYEMPEGRKTTAEDYAEFRQAYESMMRTRAARIAQERVVKSVMSQMQCLLQAHEKALVITEGCTDWKHMLRAWHKLRSRYPELEEKFEFLQFGPSGDGDARLNLEMGVTTLVDMCSQYAKLPQPRKLVFISDTDEPAKSKALREEGKAFRSWGNNVWSFEIPVPESRKDVKPGICIEHYYSDEEIVTEKVIGGISRRLFFAKEFSPRTGRSADRQLMFERFKACNSEKNPWEIIEGDMGNRVGRCDEDEEYKTNLCLSKNMFATSILHEEAPFDAIDSENFKLIFDVLTQILGVV